VIRLRSQHQHRRTVRTEKVENVTDGRIQVPINVQASIIKWRREVIHLHEEKMFIRLRVKEEGESKVWICHTGTTNDMSGSERHSLIWINLF
jgi:DNA-directed RNA polymerase